MTLIRKIDEEDLTEVQSLIEETIRRCYPRIYPPSVVDFFLKHHSRHALEKRMQKGTVLVLHEEDHLYGTGFLVENELGGVYVHPDKQGKGFGTEIVLRLLETARKKNLANIWLDATPLAKPLYDKLGFTLVSPMLQLVNNEPLHYFRMEIFL